MNVHSAQSTLYWHVQPVSKVNDTVKEEESRGSTDPFTKGCKNLH